MMGDPATGTREEMAKEYDAIHNRLFVLQILLVGILLAVILDCCFCGKLWFVGGWVQGQALLCSRVGWDCGRDADCCDS